MRYHGVFTAMVTPFKGESLDQAALEAFVEWQIAEGIHGLVPCGTTGESPTLSHEEHKRVIQSHRAYRCHACAGDGGHGFELHC